MARNPLPRDKARKCLVCDGKHPTAVHERWLTAAEDLGGGEWVRITDRLLDQQQRVVS